MESSDDSDTIKHPFFDIAKDKRPLLPFSDYYRPGMGTELVAPFLYSLVRMLRPECLLEIGSGYTTAWLARALEDNENVHIDWNVDHRYFQKPYDPKLVCIEDNSEKAEADQSSNLALNSKYVDWIDGKFEGRAAQIKEQYGEIDLVWFDCGGPDEYAHFCDEYLPISKGFVLFHFTFSWGQPNKNRHIISDSINAPPHLDQNGESLWSQIDLVEPHKFRQGSVTMLKHKQFRNILVDPSKSETD